MVPAYESWSGLVRHYLLKGAKEIIIVHNGADYRLRVTARGKLILTK